MIAAILRDSPPPLTSHAPDAPPELERIVGKALRKDREERYQLVKDLWLDLKSLKQELEIEVKLKGAPPPETIARHTDGIASAHATKSGEYLISEIKRHKRGVAAALTTLAIATVAFVWFMSFNSSINPDRSNPGQPDADSPHLRRGAAKRTDVVAGWTLHRLQFRSWRQYRHLGATSGRRQPGASD